VSRAAAAAKNGSQSNRAAGVVGARGGARKAAEAEFIGNLKIRFRFPAILTQFLVWGQACKLCLKMRFPPNQHFQNRGQERELNFKKCSRGQN
jgi:hypothetical protein